MNANTRLAQLRDLLHGPPSASAWEALCALLEAWPHAGDRHVGVAYAQAHLNAWPDHLRCALDAWEPRDHASATPHPAWALVRKVAWRACAHPQALIAVEGLDQLTTLHLNNPSVSLSGLVELLEHPRVSALRLLDVSGLPLGPREVHALASSPHLAHLEHLHACQTRMTRETVEALARSARLRELRTLDLAGNFIGGVHGADVLAASPLLAQLDTLHLSFNAIGPEGLRALAQSPHVGKLRTLSLAQCNVGWSTLGVEALAGSAALGGLEMLDLAGNDIGVAGAIALSASKTLTHLRRLNLRRNRIGAAGMRALAGSPLLARLEALDLRGDNIGPAGLDALLAAVSPELRKLDLGFNAIGPDGARLIVNTSALRGLTHLNLYRNHILAEGARALSGAPAPPRLVELNLGFNAIGDEGLAALLPMLEACAELRHLNLEHNQLSSTSACLLAASPLLTRLDTLALANNRIGRSGIDALIQAPRLPEHLRPQLPRVQAEWEEDAAAPHHPPSRALRHVMLGLARDPDAPPSGDR